ncbi:MAG: tRNA (N6-isopentenyl adenosine(37)-C2)-methylthiotransferase MiaB [Firmicutes bacterium]|jgi:tRNA-2-methylthio-N6-dimethylallyladenosine synthase|nr:tRNA (N6-isopentenyl adenosine(37)-C2)-methylthiotransferase MiaB [Bacillota bacterium]
MQVAERKVKVTAFGCQMNERDAETITGFLEKLGYAPTDSLDDADMVIFVTCCVRESAENRALANLADTKALKRRRTGLVIGICGCMVQQKKMQEYIREKMPWVDLVFGTHNIHRLPELVSRVLAGERVIEVWDEPGEIVSDVPAVRTSKISAYVNVTYGCDNFCSYCIVPYVRGRERSRTVEEVLGEVRDLASRGYREVTLLGQNVNSYGRGLPPLASGKRPDFAHLLREVDKIPGLVRVRFTTSHPKDMSDELIDTIAGARKVCEHFHLPLQAGGDRVLERMNRGYTSAQYLNLVERIRRAIENAAITTDIMVGFPGETEEDFQGTLEVVRLARFDAAFTFIYSPREGTKAATMPDQVPHDVKHERIYRLIELVNETAREVNERLRGAVVEVMVEGPSDRDPSVLAGRTRTNKMVHWKPPHPVSPGDLVLVRIDEPHTWTLHGTQVGEGDTSWRSKP